MKAYCRIEFRFLYSTRLQISASEPKWPRFSTLLLQNTSGGLFVLNRWAKERVMFQKKAYVVLFFASSIFQCQSLEGQIREVRRVLLNDIGRAGYDRRGNPVVEINPGRCRRLGPAMCEFVRAHEHAHIRLNHFHRNISTQQAEAEADSWAASHVSPNSARAAMNYFRTGNGATHIHGSSSQRAIRVADSMRNSGQYSFHHEMSPNRRVRKPIGRPNQRR